MIPSRGPSLLKVPFSDGLVLAVAPSLGSPSISIAVDINFPRSIFVTGVMALPIPDRDNFTTYEEQCAQLSLSLTDETNQPLVSDSRGTTQGTTRAPVAAPFLQLFGRAYHPIALQRPIASLDRWIFHVQNADADRAQLLSGIFIYFSEPT